MAAIATLVVAFALSLVRAPYFLLAPGTAVDLSRDVAVDGRPSPRRRFYLTDVSVARASFLTLVWCLWPGIDAVGYATVIPAGASERNVDRSMTDDMAQSQIVAAVVAERAAGLSVATPERQVIVMGFAPGTRADGPLEVGDVIASVASRPIRDAADIGDALRASRTGRPVDVRFVRSGNARSARVVAIASVAGPRLGIAIRTRVTPVRLPVAVRFALGDISGSSGGLMLALEIYAGLCDARDGRAVAGTGTLALDGTVGPIDGVRQKIIAAKRAGARIFIVPRKNYAAVARTTGIDVVPVATFAQARAAIGE